MMVVRSGCKMALLPPKMKIDDGKTIVYNGNASLGEGASGIVLPCMLEKTTPDGTTTIVEVAVKCAATHKTIEKNLLLNEMRIWKSVPDHPNVLKLLEGFVDEPNSAGDLFKCFFVTERMKSNLKHIIFEDKSFAKSCTYKVILKVLIQICRGLAHLHHHGVIHFDLKPGNILISDQGQVVLMDFGYSKIAGDYGGSVTASVRGTLGYMAPEVVIAPDRVFRSPTVRLSSAIDVFSLGVLMWVMFNRSKVGEKAKGNGQKGCHINWPSPYASSEVWCSGPPILCDLIQSCLRYSGISDASSDHCRPTVRHILTTLESMVNSDWSNSPVPSYQQESEVETVQPPTYTGFCMDYEMVEHENHEGDHQEYPLLGVAKLQGATSEVHRRDSSVTTAQWRKLTSCNPFGFLQSMRDNVALLFAAAIGLLDDVEALLAKGAHVDTKVIMFACTPLHLACAVGHTRVAKFLIENSANVNAVAINGGTPLMAAAWFGNKDIATALIAAGADVDSQYKGGKTALYMASKNACVDVVRELVACGADINVSDNEGKTPHQVAATHASCDVGYREEIQAILEAA